MWYYEKERRVKNSDTAFRLQNVCYIAGHPDNANEAEKVGKQDADDDGSTSYVPKLMFRTERVITVRQMVSQLLHTFTYRLSTSPA